MTRLKSSFNISNLQDFVLNERNIERILQHTKECKNTIIAKKNNAIQKKSLSVNMQFLLPKFNDTLFWCYYIISNGISSYEIIRGDGFKDSVEMKIQLVYSVRENKELLKKYKWKKNVIEDELANHTKISITSFMCICAMNNHNVCYIDGKKMYTLLCSEDINTNLNIIEKTERGYTLFIGNNDEKYKYFSECRDTFWQIDKLNKPLKSISNYKLKDLQTICKSLCIETHNDKKNPLKKSILYKNIQEHL
jgi:hypothetical protein